VTASELARLLHARRIGKGKWMAKCPAHPDRKPSLAIAEGRKGILLKCMSNGCETKLILSVLGLTWADLFEGKPLDKVLMRQIREQEEKHEREMQRRRELKNLALEQAGMWEAVVSRLGGLLALFPDDERLARLFHKSLALQRRCEALADALDFKCARGLGFPQRSKNNPLRQSDVGLTIAARLGLGGK
jgi:hypothetical protein